MSVIFCLQRLLLGRSQRDGRHRVLPPFVGHDPRLIPDGDWVFRLVTTSSFGSGHRDEPDTSIRTKGLFIDFSVPTSTCGMFPPITFVPDSSIVSGAQLSREITTPGTSETVI